MKTLERNLNNRDIKSKDLNSNKSSNELKEILSQTPQSNIAPQIQFEADYLKEMGVNVNKKIEEITNLQTDIVSISLIKDIITNELKTNYIKKLDSLDNRVKALNSNYTTIEQRLNFIEREKEKLKILRSSSKVNKNNTIIEPKCVNRGSCSTCLQDPSCVWCNTSNKCVLGDMYGSLDGSCSDFKYATCNISCNYKTCSECLSDINCGWCESSKRCIEGSSTAPISSTCSDNYIHKLKGRCGTHSNFLK
jgi:hypothetical protein